MPANRFGSRLLAYVDILGWSDLISRKRTSEIQWTINAGLFNLEANVQVEAARKGIFIRSGFKNGTSVIPGFFSDTFVCSCKPLLQESHLLLDRVQKFCGGLLGNGLYPRGAVVVGDLLHTDSGAIVGQALLDAHATERSVATYPRLIVSDEAEPLLRRLRRTRPNRYGPPQVRVDPIDGFKHMDLFPRWIAGKRTSLTHAEVVRAKAIVGHVLCRDADGADLRARKIRAKLQWMFAYLKEIEAEPIDDRLSE